MYLPIDEAIKACQFLNKNSQEELKPVLEYFEEHYVHVFFQYKGT